MRRALFGLIGAGAALLAVAQFLPLFHSHINTSTATLGSGSVGAAHAFLVLPLAVLALILGWGAVSTGSRFALVLVGVVAVAVLVIALGHDLPHARDSGLKILGVGDFAEERNVVAIGLYVEIAGALVLLMATVGGFLLAGPALYEVHRQRPRLQRQPRDPRRRPRSARGGDGRRRRSRSEPIGRRYDEE